MQCVYTCTCIYIKTCKHLPIKIHTCTCTIHMHIHVLKFTSVIVHAYGVHNYYSIIATRELKIYTYVHVYTMYIMQNLSAYCIHISTG